MKQVMIRPSLQMALSAFVIALVVPFAISQQAASAEKSARSDMKPNQTPIMGNEADRDGLTPHRALVEFYRAFNTRDLSLMSRNWDNAPDISMDNPLGGIKRGWDEVRPVYEKLFNGPATVYVEYYDYTIHEHGQIFFAVGRERGQFQIEDHQIDLRIRTSRIFRMVNGRWRQVHHHGSIEDPDLLARYQAAVLGKK